MNTTIRNLIIAAPLATAAFTMVPAAAMASEPAPVIILPPNTDPQPDLDIAIPAPEPKDPQDKAPAPKPAEPKGPQDLSDAPKPKGPGDIANPEPEPTHPDGPGDLTNPKPCPTHGVDCTPDTDEPNGGNGGKDGEAKKSVDDVVDTVALPNRIDAGLASEEQDGGLDLAWLFAGGLAVTASGAAFAVRKRTRSNA
jgi:hypothetical protein